MGKRYHNFDLEERTYNFARSVSFLCKRIPLNVINSPYISQVIRSSNSCAANYIEANESCSKKDFIYRLRISRKETKETILHLRLIQANNKSFQDRISPLINEATELIKIFSTIINKSL
ncbi:four helix bundle protein [Candidatus Dojkabacteria bacterium]|nr:four helix bundle protein [Candidatus Dojkabacteria bacterium]